MMMMMMMMMMIIIITFPLLSLWSSVCNTRPLSVSSHKCVEGLLLKIPSMDGIYSFLAQHTSHVRDDNLCT